MIHMSSYNEIHKRLRRLRGPAHEHTCPCGSPAAEWAYQFTGNPELRDTEGRLPHSTNLDDYAAMCRSCHILFDVENDPERVTEKMRESGRRLSELMSKRRRRCLQCGLVGAPGAMGNHQRHYRHTGLEDTHPQPDGQ